MTDTPSLPALVAKRASIAALKAKISDGVDVNEVDFKGWTALHWALVRERDEVVSLLLESGADANHPTGTGRLPLIIAIRSGQGRAVKLLLEAGADPDLADSTGQTPLAASRTGRFPELSEIFSGRISGRG
ncbi:MAG: ankyrin repeat domain-containing protein [Chloroflexi bacterium]|nr:ankyrin repeat domain-containing protein [Chloroflexota bacterium]